MMKHEFIINHSGFDTRFATIGICKHEDLYLLMRLADDFPFCPGDWDFVISRIYHPLLTNEENILASVKEHTGLESVIRKRGRVYIWNDSENKNSWILYPCMVDVNSLNVSLSNKFSESKWVKYDNIIKHDRCNYFKNILDHIDLRK